MQYTTFLPVLMYIAIHFWIWQIESGILLAMDQDLRFLKRLAMTDLAMTLHAVIPTRVVTLKQRTAGGTTRILLAGDCEAPPAYKYCMPNALNAYFE